MSFPPTFSPHNFFSFQLFFFICFWISPQLSFVIIDFLLDCHIKLCARATERKIRCRRRIASVLKGGVSCWQVPTWSHDPPLYMCLVLIHASLLLLLWTITLFPFLNSSTHPSTSYIILLKQHKNAQKSQNKNFGLFAILITRGCAIDLNFSSRTKICNYFFFKPANCVFSFFSVLCVFNPAAWSFFGQSANHNRPLWFIFSLSWFSSFLTIFWFPNPLFCHRPPIFIFSIARFCPSTHVCVLIFIYIPAKESFVCERESRLINGHHHYSFTLTIITAHCFPVLKTLRSDLTSKTKNKQKS